MNRWAAGLKAAVFAAVPAANAPTRNAATPSRALAEQPDPEAEPRHRKTGTRRQCDQERDVWIELHRERLTQRRSLRVIRRG